MGGTKSRLWSNFPSLTSFATCLPTLGSNCINPSAFAREIALGLNSDSCRISDATRKGSKVFSSEYFLKSVQKTLGNNASQNGRGTSSKSKAKYPGTERLANCRARKY